MNKIFDKIKNNKKIFAIILVGLILLVLVVVLFRSEDGIFFEILDKETKTFINEYEKLNGELSSEGMKYPEVNIPDKNNIKYLTIKETLDILDGGTGAIYFGYPECIYCRSAVQVLFDTAKESDIESVYYLDISEVWDIKEIDKDGKVATIQEADSNYSKLLEELDDIHIENYVLKDKDGKEIDTKEKRIVVPLVIFVVNGNIVSSNVGTLFSQTNPYIPLNDDQVKGLSEIYGYGLRDVVNGLNNK